MDRFETDWYKTVSIVAQPFLPFNLYLDDLRYRRKETNKSEIRYNSSDFENEIKNVGASVLSHVYVLFGSTLAASRVYPHTSKLYLPLQLQLNKAMVAQ